MTAEPQPGAKRETVAGGTLVGFFAECLVLPLGLVSTIYLTRTLGAVGFGELSIILAIVAPVAWTVSLACSGRGAIALVSADPENESNAALVLRTAVIAGAICFLCFVAAVPFLSSILKQPELRVLFWVAAVEIALMPLVFAHRSILIARGEFYANARMIAFYRILRVVMMIGFVAAGLGVEGAVVAAILSRLIELTWCRRFVRPSFFARVSWRRARYGRAFGGTVLSSLAQQIANSAPLLLLSAFATPAVSLGHFAAATAVASVPGLFGQVYNGVVLSRLVGFRAEPERFAELDTVTFRTALIAVAMCAPAAGAAESVVQVVLGAQYAPASSLFPWLVLNACSTLLVGSQSVRLSARNSFLSILAIIVPAAVLTVTALLVALPEAGPLGAARILGVVGAAAAAVSLIAFARHPGAQGELLILKCLAAAVAGFLVAQTLVGLIWPLVDVAVGCIVTLLILFLSSVLSVKDLRTLISGSMGFRHGHVDLSERPRDMDD